MTDERDDRIGKRYRELPREEPPRALDDAILAAARRELETQPAPLVAPTGRRRWMFPVAAAAVIVLSAVLTVQMQREQPDLDLVSAPPPAEGPPPAAKQEKASPRPVPQVQPEAKHAEGRMAARREEAPPRRDQPRAVGPSIGTQAGKEPATQPAQPPALADSVQPKPTEERGRFAPDPVPAAPPEQRPVPQAPAPAAAPAPRAVPERDSLSRRAESMTAKSEVVGEPPERMLERIAMLRREGRAKEADDLYAEFRRRFPDYRIPESMREQVLPR